MTICCLKSARTLGRALLEAMPGVPAELTSRSIRSRSRGRLVSHCLAVRQGHLGTLVVIAAAVAGFSCESVPLSPRPLAPGQGSRVELPAKFSWTVCDDADSYRVQLHTEPDFYAPLLDTTVRYAHLLLGADLPSGRYVWRVSQYTSSGRESEFSVANSFTITGWAYPRRLVTTVPVGPRPACLGLRPDGREVWVGSSDTADRNLYVVSSDSLVVTHRVATHGYEHGEIVFDRDGARAFTAMRIGFGDPAGGEIEAFSTADYVYVDNFYRSCGAGCHRWPWGYGICTDPTKEYIYAVDGEDGEVDRYCIVRSEYEELGDPVGAIDVAADPYRAAIYACGPNGQFVVHEANELEITAIVSTGARLGPLVLTNGGRYAFIGYKRPAGFLAMDLVTLEVAVRKDLPTDFAWAWPFALTLTPDERFLFLCDRESSFVHIADVSDPLRPRFVEHLQLDGQRVNGVAITPDGARAYLSVEPTGVVVLER